MRRVALLSLALFSLVFATASIAKTSEIPPIVKSGLDAYVAGGPDAAIKALIAGSGLEGNTQALTQANVLRQVEDYYGKPESYDVLKSSAISPRSQFVYAAINYGKGILYARFQLYRKSDGSWITTEFSFNTKAQEVLPSDLLVGSVGT
jgi:hypothetical protein